MKVLHVNTVCKTGSTGKIVYNLHKHLEAQGYESMVCYGRGPNLRDPRLVKLSSSTEARIHTVLTRLTGMQGTFSFWSTKSLIRIIENFRPDVVHLYNLHGYYLDEFHLLDYLKRKRLKTVYSMLDEYPYMGKCCYSYECLNFKTICHKCPQVHSYPTSWIFDKSRKIFVLKQKAYENFDSITFTGPPWVIERAKDSALLNNRKLVIIDEPIDVETTFFPREVSELRAKHQLQIGKKVVLTVTPFSNPRKGGQYFLELAQHFEHKTNEMVFIFVGFDGDTTSLPKNVIPIGYVSDQNELALYYSLADMFVCTSLADTMPNVCLEALSCGTPIAGFNISGIPSVAEPPLGIFTPVGDIEALAQTVKKAALKDLNIINSCRKYAVERYSMSTISSSFQQLYQNG